MDTIRLLKPLGSPRVFSCKRPFSNIQFNQREYGYLPSLARILSQCRKADCQTIVEESIPNEFFSKEEDLELTAANVKFKSSRLIKLSFFKSAFLTLDAVNAQTTNDFFGYAILKEHVLENSSFWTVFESILAPTRHDNNFVHTRRKYEVLVGGEKNFEVIGNIYCQQNGITSRCAHVALRTVLSSILPEGDISCSEMNQILVKHNKPFKVGQGLDREQINAIVKEKGFFTYEFESNQDGTTNPLAPPYTKYLYGSIESGFPALVGFKVDESGEGHIIPILGHTFNEDTWVPNADSSYFRIGHDIRYVPSERWVSAYVGHDDNFGSNFCIPKDYLVGKRPYVLAILPKDCQYNPIIAEVLSIDFLHLLVQEPAGADACFWKDRLRKACSSGWVVLRPLLMTGAEYVSHLKDIDGWEGERISPEVLSVLERNMKGLYWMVEIAYPELFPANRRKIGEIILKADAPFDINNYAPLFLMARFPSTILLLEKHDNSYSLENISSGISDHVPLFVMNGPKKQ